MSDEPASGGETPLAGRLDRPPADPAERLEDQRLHGELRSRLFGEVPSRVQIGDYEVLHKLGRGGGGTVFAVRDPQGRRRALKLVASADTRLEARLRREARALAALEHPHIVRVHDTGTHEDGVYVVLDLIEGVTLRRWASESSSWSQTLACVLPVLGGLFAAHEQGILHRDLKPDNILVEPSAHAWLLDFGLARPLPGSDAQDLTHMSQALTRTGAVVGTVGYIAPEHLMGRPVDERADQFSVSVVVWEALYGRPPFVGATADAIGLAALREQIERPESSDVPDGVEQVLRQGLRSDPGQRHASVKALASALEKSMREPEGQDQGKVKGWLSRWRKPKR